MPVADDDWGRFTDAVEGWGRVVVVMVGRISLLLLTAACSPCGISYFRIDMRLTWNWRKFWTLHWRRK